jgi:hypothetical protein
MRVGLRPAALNEDRMPSVVFLSGPVYTLNSIHAIMPEGRR